MRRPSSPADPGGGGSSLLRRLAVAGLIAVALLLPAPRASAHGGPPLRIGVTADPTLNAVGRLVLSHMREGVGFGVDWREFPDERALRAAFAAGKVDIAVGVTAPGATLPSTAACPSETLARLRDDLRRDWGGEVFVLTFARGSSACERPVLIVSRAVLEDLRFGILGREAERFASVVTPEDAAAVRAAAARGGERAAAAAARAATTSRTRR